MPSLSLLFVVYNSLGYLDVVAGAAEALMNLAVHEIAELPDYAQKGKVLFSQKFGGENFAFTVSAMYNGKFCFSG